MTMNDHVPAKFSAALEEAMTPTSADVLAAKQLVLAALTGGALATNKLHARVRRHHAIPDAVTGEVLDLPADADPSALISRDVPQLARIRSTRATALALAQLQASGVLLPVTEPAGHDSVRTHSGSRTGGYETPTVRLHTERAYQLAHPVGTEPELLDPDIYTAQIADLLGPRGVRCLTEALHAHRQGLQLAAVNMLGAASEAAWYSLAAGLRDRSPALGRKVDENATISVIGQVCDLLVKEVKEARANAVDELRSHATYLRDLRNYGLHPRGEVTGDLEHHFTEQSVAMTFMSTHRYFGRLAALAAQLPPSPAPQDRPA